MPIPTARIACAVPVDHGRVTRPITTTARPGPITLRPQTASLQDLLIRRDVASSMQAIAGGIRRQNAGDVGGAGATFRPGGRRPPTVLTGWVCAQARTAS